MHSTTSQQKILVVDDELNIRKTLSMCLEAEGHHVIAVSNPVDALAEAKRGYFDLAFLDIRLGTANGVDLIQPLMAQIPWLKVVIITAHATIETAVEAMKRGAVDYMPKPFTPAQVELAVAKAASLRALEQRVESLQAIAEEGFPAVVLTSENPQMQRIYALAEQAAHSDAAVLIGGENGTGKNLLAKAIHQWSPRAVKPFSVVSCPSLSGELLESELFGHAQGAFTGAIKDNPGRVAQTEGGTIFLDEIGDLPSALQPKLLRFLQSKEYERVGDSVTRRADVRVIAATNVDLKKAVQEGRFREDLYYRLNVVDFELPPLRERMEDLGSTVENLLHFFSKRGGKQIVRFTDEAMAMLMAHHWPGNFRELSNIVERATIFCTGQEIGPAHLPDGLATESSATPRLGDPVSLEIIEEHHIRRVLATTTSLQDAADLLGIDQATLWRRRKKYEI